MKRDMDLVRRIALATADLPHDGTLDGLDGVDQADFGFHVMWMVEAGLVNAEVSEFMSGEPPTASVFRLTWTGCEFADAARNDTIWSKAKKQVLIPSGSWTFGLLTDWLKAEIKEGLPSLRG